MKDTYKVLYWPKESLQKGYILPEEAKQEKEFESLDEAYKFVSSISGSHFTQTHTIGHCKRYY